MTKYCGKLVRVGSKEGDMMINSGSAMSTVRVSGKVSIIEIGDTTLRDVGCTNDLYDLLDPGRDACLWVHHHFMRKPVIVGVKYRDDGKVYNLRFGTLVASALSYLLIYPLLILVGGMMIGLMGGKGGGFMSTLAVLFIVGGLGLCVWNAVMLVKVYLAVGKS